MKNKSLKSDDQANWILDYDKNDNYETVINVDCIYELAIMCNLVSFITRCCYLWVKNIHLINDVL